MADFWATLTLSVEPWRGLVAAIAAAFVLPTLWIRIRTGSLRLAQRRTLQLRTLLLDQQHSITAAALAWQLACREAFGRRLDDRDIRFALSRHNALGLIEDRTYAHDYVRLRDDQQGFEATNRRWPSFRFWAKVLPPSGLIGFAMLFMMGSTSSAFTVIQSPRRWDCSKPSHGSSSSPSQMPSTPQRVDS